MRKKMRTLLVLILALAMALSLCACGEKKEETSQEKPAKTDEPAKPGELVYTYDSMTLKDERLTDGIYPLVFTASTARCTRK